MPTTIIMLVLISYIVGSLFYVYRYRGQTRWKSLKEYLRKGWPIFAPFNCLLYLFTEARARKPIMNAADFPELAEIQTNWKTIAEEVRALYQARHLDQTNKPENDAYYDIGFRTFYKYGWSKFYLTWYGTKLNSAQKLCPKTVEIVSKVPSVNGAMLTILPKGGKLTRHLDPIACSLRYHLGLLTPNDNACFINVDGINHSWRDGQVLLFDETYLHYANNDASSDRVILMLDVERPMNFLGKIINFFYKGFARMSVVPNMEGDQRGMINLIFSSLSPILRKTKELKQTNRPLYLTVKYGVNFSLFLVLAGIVYSAINLAQKLL
ncbi:MAG: aspartyl/asparaginyl beta-hydroxylase domain-containing protein [Bacteriovoracaceae bacterium]|nr:aspartyl/asparaginyl beta-hydroxylase domain-containing protein [Bacteriovoracaceae bacterium]